MALGTPPPTPVALGCRDPVPLCPAPPTPLDRGREGTGRGRGQGGTGAPVTRCRYLDAAVAPVGHDDVAVGVDGHPGGGVELPVALPVRPELEQELAVRAVHLGTAAGTRGRHRRHRHRPPAPAAAAPTFTEWLWKSVTTISFLLFTATKWGPGWGTRWGQPWAVTRGHPHGHGTQPVPASSRCPAPRWDPEPRAPTRTRTQSPSWEPRTRPRTWAQTQSTEPGTQSPSPEPGLEPTVRAQHPEPSTQSLV